MDKQKETSALEDLMSEHGILNRLLLIYEKAIENLEKDIYFDIKIVNVAAKLVRRFVEDYHEKTEERYVFPVLQQLKIETELVNELILQHKLGRVLTNNIIALTEKQFNKNKLIKYMRLFIKMYRFHECKEDTIIFRLFKNAVTDKEYNEYGEKFETEEEAVLGEDGFNKILELVAVLEKKIDIYDLNKITKEINLELQKN